MRIKSKFYLLSIKPIMHKLIYSNQHNARNLLNTKIVLIESDLWFWNDYGFPHHFQPNRSLV